MAVSREALVAALEAENCEASVSPVSQASDSPVAQALQVLLTHCKGHLETVLARGKFVRNVQISIVVAFWTVIMSLPVVIWPWARYLNDSGCHKLSVIDCVKQEKCRISRAQMACEPTKPNAYLDMWGTMILQFVFSVYTDLGSTVKLTIQGAFGTLLALANIEILNGLLSFWLGGGAYPDRIGLSDNQVVSSWLPLCTDGIRLRTETQDAFCLFNVWWAKVTLAGAAKISFIWVDFIAFVALCLTFGFDNNTRIFALSTHVFFMMSFVDPAKDSFHSSPTYSSVYSWMILAASVISVLCFFIPHRRFTALEVAFEFSREAVKATGALLENMPSVSDEFTRRCAASALESTDEFLNKMDANIDLAWFESFGWCKCKLEERKRLRIISHCLRQCLQRMRLVHEMAGSLGANELGPEEIEALRQASAAAQALLADKVGKAIAENISGNESMQTAESSDAYASLQLPLSRLADTTTCQEVPGNRSPNNLAFIFVSSAVLTDVMEALHTMHMNLRDIAIRPSQTAWCTLSQTFWWTVAVRSLVRRSGSGFQFVERSATHPRFVVRNSLSICLAFLVGWLGIWNVMPSYSAYPSSTIAVCVYTFTGATASITLRRVSGVVLGKVAGAILQLAFAIRTWYYAVLFAVSMWLIVALPFFGYLHGEHEIGYVCCLTAAFAAGNMIPSNGMFRDLAESSFSKVLPGLMNTIIQTVLGIGIMLFVDFALASRATHQAKQRLSRGLRRVRRHATYVVQSTTTEQRLTQYSKDVLDDLDALKATLPYAAAEPTYWRRPFETELYRKVETHLRFIHAQACTIAWAVQFPEQPPLSSQLAAMWQGVLGSYSQRLDYTLHVASESINLLVSRNATADCDHEAQQVHEEIQSSLYSVRAAKNLLAAAKYLIRVATRRAATTARTNESLASMNEGTAPTRNARNIVNQLRNEILYTGSSFVSDRYDPSGSSVGDGDDQDFLTRVEQLRSLMMSEEEGMALQISGRIEVAISSMRSVLEQLREMEFSILQV